MVCGSLEPGIGGQRVMKGQMLPGYFVQITGHGKVAEGLKGCNGILRAIVKDTCYLGWRNTLVLL